jgi:sugar phosphate isomerase/epimerase
MANNTMSRIAMKNAVCNELFEDIIQHVQLNEIDRGYPGSGNSDFLPAFDALQQIDYCGWVSLEVFNQTGSPEKILSETSQVINTIEKQ